MSIQSSLDIFDLTYDPGEPMWGKIRSPSMSNTVPHQVNNPPPPLSPVFVSPDPQEVPTIISMSPEASLDPILLIICRIFRFIIVHMFILFLIMYLWKIYKFLT
ncbi:nvc1_027 [Namao virus]|nr:nvc1_027 [Namao virus]